MWPNTVRKEDLKIDFYRGSGKGGQNRNKRDTACRITHLPTGIAVTCEEQRTQGQNKKIAFQRLCDKLVPLMKEAIKPDLGPVDLTRKRTYNEHRGIVTDHITGKTANYERVLNGDLDELMG